MYNTNNFNLNQFLKNIKLKKQHLKNFKTKMSLIFEIKENNYKCLYSSLLHNDKNYKFYDDHLITYIIDITFSQTNTFLHIMDFSGKLEFFYYAGLVVKSSDKKKKKVYRSFILNKFYRILTSKKFAFLKGKPIALHLTNVTTYKSIIVKQLNKKFFIRCIHLYNIYAHNGCRRKKVRRKKFRRRRKIKEEWLSWF